MNFKTLNGEKIFAERYGGKMPLRAGPSTFASPFAKATEDKKATVDRKSGAPKRRIRSFRSEIVGENGL